MMYSAILVSNMAPQNLVIQYKLKALHHLFSDIDVFGNGSHFLNGIQHGRYHTLDVLRNTFSEIYAPENLYIESTMMSLRLLVFEIW